ncbi:hypothetical protein EEI45_04515 [Erysipelothrix piscisicarius]|uniref:LURP-one-related family protein n=1 Tax=Erysipelothrix piscisicarius TaxID=2485784 RepID=A0A3Q8S7D1_9FIRM|nr:LURP-one-related family protein [Erysipelothrix piscisicarius]AZK44110.1 hypothetical protein EEI45_04515 [Erysipelothrix piscisicarius]
MKLYIKQHVFSIRDRFEVKDENGTTVYTVKGPALTIGRKFTIQDATQKSVATVKQRPFRFLSEYTLITPDHKINLKKNFTFLKMKFSLKHLDWKLSGDYLDHHYKVTSRDNTIMTISKKWLRWGDSYELDINDDRNALICLCIAIAIDAELAKSKQTVNNSNT